MMARRVVDVKEVGKKQIISLSCGHAITRAIGYYGSRNDWNHGKRKEECPQCGREPYRK